MNINVTIVKAVNSKTIQQYKQQYHIVIRKLISIYNYSKYKSAYQAGFLLRMSRRLQHIQLHSALE